VRDNFGPADISPRRIKVMQERNNRAQYRRNVRARVAAAEEIREGRPFQEALYRKRG
jgi:hypothetical protein